MVFKWKSSGPNTICWNGIDYFSPLYCLCSFVKDWLTLLMLVCFWELCSVLLVHQSVFPLVLHYLDCCCSVIQLYLTLCNPMDCSTPGFPVLHHLSEFTQTHVQWVGDAGRRGRKTEEREKRGNKVGGKSTKEKMETERGGRELVKSERKKIK